MRSKLLIGCVVAICCGEILPSSRAANNFAFTGSVDRSGDRSGAIQIANDFTVNSSTGINVTQLGLFIDGYDGFFVTGPSEMHKITLFNRGTGATVASVNISGSNINTIDGPFAYAHAGNSQSVSPQVQGSWGYVNITPVLLPSGFQGSIVAYTMSDGGGAYIDDYGDSAGFNSGGGLISFTHSFYATTTSTSGDPASNSSTEPYGAGSFTFAAPPVPEPAGLSLFTIASISLLCRRRAAIRPI